MFDSFETKLRLVILSGECFSLCVVWILSVALDWPYTSELLLNFHHVHSYSNVLEILQINSACDSSSFVVASSSPF